MDEQTVNGPELEFDTSDLSEPETVEQNVETESSPAVEETTEQSAEQEQTPAEPAASTEQEAQTGDAIYELEKLDDQTRAKFLKQKGLNPDDPDAFRKVTEMYFNAEKGFYQKSQEKAQLERRLAETQASAPSPADEQALKEVRSMRTEMTVAKWKQEKGLTEEAEQKMMAWCAEPMRDSQGNIRRDQNGNPIVKGWNYINGNMSLDDIYRLSGADAIKVDDLTEKIRNEVKEEMAARQNAKRPSASSTDSTKFGTPQENDPFMDGLLN